MLLAAFSIAQGLGPREDRRTPEQKQADAAAGRVGDNVVGAARLGLWCGRRLLGELLAVPLCRRAIERADSVCSSAETDQAAGNVQKAREQWALNQAHERVMKREKQEFA